MTLELDIPSNDGTMLPHILEWLKFRGIAYRMQGLAETTITISAEIEVGDLVGFAKLLAKFKYSMPEPECCSLSWTSWL